MSTTTFRMIRKKRPGDRSVIHTPSEIVRCTFDNGIVTADCKGTNAKRTLEKKGFVLKEEIKPALSNKAGIGLLAEKTTKKGTAKPALKKSTVKAIAPKKRTSTKTKK